jgi:DNA-directed RNA polymerase subunit RPC12/RpoP
MKKYIFDEGGAKCFDCGAEFVPREKNMVTGEEIAIGEVAYCDCPSCGGRCGYATRVE